MLVPSGQLVDIRPQATNPEVEVVLHKSVQIAGHLDDSASEIDYQAADSAMATMIAHGRFAKQRQKRFTFAYYWQTPDEMKAYIEEVWSSYSVLSPLVVQQAAKLSPKGHPVQYRIRESVIIADYRRLPAIQPATPTT